jgi:hypothetical protein
MKFSAHTWFALLLLALGLATAAAGCVTDLTELRQNARPPEDDASVPDGGSDAGAP